jgi:hypothetical protein
LSKKNFQNINIENSNQNEYYGQYSSLENKLNGWEDLEKQLDDISREERFKEKWRFASIKNAFKK